MRGTLFCMPSDPAKAAALLVLNREKLAGLWRLHGIARRLTDRLRLADQARQVEAEILALEQAGAGQQRVPVQESAAARTSGARAAIETIAKAP